MELYTWEDGNPTRNSTHPSTICIQKLRQHSLRRGETIAAIHKLLCLPCSEIYSQLTFHAIDLYSVLWQTVAEFTMGV